jgi:hypothetical protein
MELAHYVDHLQDENDELRKLMGWLSSLEPRVVEQAIRAHVHKPKERSDEIGHVLPVREARALHHRVPESHGGQA